MYRVNTPKKVLNFDTICFICKKEECKKHRTRIFGRSLLDIPSILERLGELKDLADYAEYSTLFLCRSCLQKVKRFSSVEKAYTELKREIQSNLNNDVKLRSKRVSPGVEESAKKSLKYNDTSSTQTLSSVPRPCFSESPVRSSSIHDAPRVFCLVGFQNTSTPLKHVPQVHRPTRNLPVKQRTADGSQKSTVTITLTYPSKTIKQELTGEYEVIGKALIHKNSLAIAKAVLRSKDVRNKVVERILRILQEEINGLCSSRNPSILRKSTRDDLINFDLEKLCYEWKERAPLFYSVLLTCCLSPRKSAVNDAKWFPAMAVAGSVILKERNQHMSALASILGIAIKTRSMEVRFISTTKINHLSHLYEICTLLFVLKSTS